MTSRLFGGSSTWDGSIHPSIRGLGSEPPRWHGAGGSWSAESPQETWGAGAAHDPGPLLSSRAKSFLMGNLPSVKTKSESKES